MPPRIPCTCSIHTRKRGVARGARNQKKKVKTKLRRRRSKKGSMIPMAMGWMPGSGSSSPEGHVCMYTGHWGGHVLLPLLLLPPAGNLLAAAARGGHGGGALEPRGRARDGDPAGVLEAELLLGLAQQLPEQRVVEVHHGDHVPHRLAPGFGAAHVHRHLPLGRGGLRRRVLQQPVLPPAATPPQEPHPPRQRPPPRQHPRRGGVPVVARPRHQLLLVLPGGAHRGGRQQGRPAAVAATASLARPQAEVPTAAAAPAVAERPAPDAEQLPAEPEPPAPPRRHPTSRPS
ncbi:hypothetical protein PVAP13_1KG411805 [Panicum virgatum]|uniref:Uncharacterized protein n=1 Tax=Panicum virgatum TaxID=38727 RepID=A0A8T0XFE6_PANVG|nr:hypothetical protein PVAP13_1KG411805 [Panicum virgatum]